jgi:hypothetical protein
MHKYHMGKGCQEALFPLRIHLIERLGAINSLSRSVAISRNCSRAASRSSTISWARMSGSGRLADPSRLSSLSEKMSRLTLSRLMQTVQVSRTIGRKSEREKTSPLFLPGIGRCGYMVVEGEVSFIPS